MKKTLIKLITIFIFITIFTGCNMDKDYFKCDGWAIEVEDALNAFLKKNSNKVDDNYVVFDFDNTISIFDTEEQLAIYQLEHMAFNLTSKELAEVLKTGLSDLDADLTKYGYGNGSYNDWILDICNAYQKLIDKYGAFKASGLNDEDSVAIKEDEDWQEFATKMRALYDLVYDNESADVAYPWITYWFFNMTAKEIYDLAYNSHTYYSKVETSKETWKTPEGYVSNVGDVAYAWTCGLGVSENLKELIKVLSLNDIHVWICSASHMEVIKAAVDYFGLHDYVDGVLAITNVYEDNKMLNKYDYETGHAYLTSNDGWQEDDLATHTQTQGKGKVEAILNTLYKKYNKGPIAGFMDSGGDFNFCSEFSSLELVVCFNRASRKVTDGGGLISEVAIYQRDYLGLDFKTALENGDTLYLLQGRDENKRTLRNSNATIRLNETIEKLFANNDNELQLEYMITNKLNTKQILELFAYKTDAKDRNNLLGIEYGFLNEYQGYHSID